MNKYLKANRDHWNELVPVHGRSAFYDVEGFKAGKSTLNPIELEELGNVSGKSLLHLQCHFGLDTMSWARLGARVTGVDFSEKAIDLAQSLSRELGLEAAFVLSSLYDLPDVLDEEGRFDIVFTSYGVLCWLPDLTLWAQVIAHFLKAGGTFYLVEFHPFGEIFDDAEDATDLHVRYPYFQGQEPLHFEPEGSYADPAAGLSTANYQWTHPISGILNSLVSAGLTIDFLHEFPQTAFRQFPFLKKCPDGWWRLDKRHGMVPLLFSLKATKTGD